MHTYYIKHKKQLRPILKKGGQAFKRHTHSTAAGIEDATAVALDLLLETEAFRLYLEGRTRQIVEILRAVRAGPYEYDQERTCGSIVIKRRLSR